MLCVFVIKSSEIPMLTREKLTLFEEFNGDIDGWTRMRRDADPSHMTMADWNLIDRLIMDLGIAEAGLATAEFRAETEERLRDNAADEDTRDALRALAARLNRKNWC